MCIRDRRSCESTPEVGPVTILASEVVMLISDILKKRYHGIVNQPSHGSCPLGVHGLRYGFMVALADSARVIFPKTGLSGNKGVFSDPYGLWGATPVSSLVCVFFDTRMLYSLDRTLVRKLKAFL